MDKRCVVNRYSKDYGVIINDKLVVSTLNRYDCTRCSIVNSYRNKSCLLVQIRVMSIEGYKNIRAKGNDSSMCHGGMTKFE